MAKKPNEKIPKSRKDILQLFKESTNCIGLMARLQIAVSQNRLRDTTPFFSRGPAHRYNLRGPTFFNELLRIGV